jgi:hypothetical protein
MAAGQVDSFSRLQRPYYSFPVDNPHIAAAAVVDSILSSSIDSEPRLRRTHQPGIDAPVTHDAAAFSPEMAAGAYAAPRLSLGVRTPLPALIFIEAFSFDSVLGSWLDGKSRLAYPQHLAPLDNPHISSPFSVEMAAGWAPRSPKLPVIRQLAVPPLIFLDTTPLVDSILASSIDSEPRLRYPQQRQPDWVYIPVVIVPDAGESCFAGNKDARNHLRYPQHLQTTNNTHIDPEALEESILSSSVDSEPRLEYPHQLRLPDLVFIQSFQFESVLGSQLDARRHLTYPQHLPGVVVPVHTQAPFGIEMVQSVLASQPRIMNIKRHFVIFNDGGLIGIVTVVPTIRNLPLLGVG